MDEKFNIVVLDEPVDEQGHRQVMVFPGGTDGFGRPMWYVQVLPDQHGRMEGFLTFEDLKPGGRLDREGRLRFIQAFYNGPLGVMPDGTTKRVVAECLCPTNPINVLPQLPAAINTYGIPPFMIPVAQQVADILFSNGILLPLEEETEETELFLPNSNGQNVRICNCLVTVVSLREVLSKEDHFFEVELKLVRLRQGKRMTYFIVIPQQDIEKVKDIICHTHPWFCVATETRGASDLLAEYIRNQLDSVPKVTVFKSTGWHRYQDQMIFVHDSAPSVKNVVFDTGKHLIVDNSLSAQQAFHSACSILKIGRLSVMLPLMLIAMLGPLFVLFEEAGYTPRFCGYLHGLSGSLKTAVAIVLHKFFVGQNYATFRDTVAAVDVAVKEHPDQMLLVDDFQPATVAAEGTAMRKVLEHVLRIFGDAIGKRRSNSRATAAHGEKPHGSCLITGEGVSGSYSSLLRCLQIPIERGDIDGVQLRRYQENPALWSTNFQYMLPWVGLHWDYLVGKIRDKFPNLRSELANSTSEPRLVDTGAVLLLTAEIFLEYGVSLGAIAREDAPEVLCEWRGIIEDLLCISNSSAQELDVTVLTREAIVSAQVAGQLKIAKDINTFLTGQDGFYHQDRLFLSPTSFERILRQHCAAQQVACVGPKAVLAELYRQGMLLRDEESGKDSYLKRSPTIPALSKRLRMLAFVRDSLENED